MALSESQRAICRLIADHRRQSGESYVAGDVPLTAFTASTRLSRDIDLFHDTGEAVQESWRVDRALLEQAGYEVAPLRERGAFVEASVSRSDQSVLLQWTADSAFRFFPLVEHDDFGLTLHPFDLATNKVLALVGRVEVRDWVDILGCQDRIQRLGYLAWAACGKDPGFSPAAILAEAGRTARYSAVEVAALQFAGPPPDASTLALRWRQMLAEARALIALLPPTEVGRCVLGTDGTLFTGDVEQLREAIGDGRIRFHQGSIRGALPEVRAG